MWDLDHAENELWKQPPDPVLEAVAKIVSSENREWEGNIREIISKNYNDGPVGLPGNDDSGAMSSWLAFHMIDVYKRQGFYQWLFLPMEPTAFMSISQF